MPCLGLELLCEVLVGAHFPSALVTDDDGNGVHGIRQLRRHGAEPQTAHDVQVA